MKGARALCAPPLKYAPGGGLNPKIPLGYGLVERTSIRVTGFGERPIIELFKNNTIRATTVFRRGNTII